MSSQSSPPYFNVMSYGAVGNGPTGAAADTAAFMAAVADATAAKGGTVFAPAPQSSYCINQTIVVDADDVGIAGSGAQTFHDVPSTLAGSLVQWQGAVGATMFSFTATSAAGGPVRARCFMRDMSLDSNGAANIGLQISSVVFGRWENLYFDGPSSGLGGFGYAAINTVCQTNLGEHSDTQNNLFANISIRNQYGLGACMVLDGDPQQSHGNTSYNTFINLSLSPTLGHGIVHANTDNNTFLRCVIQPTTGDAVRLMPGNVSNKYYSLSAPGGTIRAMARTAGNVFEWLDVVSNNTPTPTIDPTPNVSTTVATAVTSGQVPGTVTVTPASMTNIVAGAALDINVGLSDQETVIVSAPTASTFTAHFQIAHGAGFTVTGAPTGSLVWSNDTGDVHYRRMLAVAKGATAPVNADGDLGTNRGTGGAVQFGPSTNQGTIDYNLVNPNVFTFSKQVVGTFDNVHFGAVAPTYYGSGGQGSALNHKVRDTVTATGTSTTVTFASTMAFTAATGYLVVVFDETALGAVTALTAKTASSFTFASISGHVYSYTAEGA